MTRAMWEDLGYACLAGGLGLVALLYLVCISRGGVDLIQTRVRKSRRRRGPGPRHVRPRK